MTQAAVRKGKNRRLGSRTSQPVPPSRQARYVSGCLVRDNPIVLQRRGGSEEANWRASFDVDLMGTVHLVNAALPYLERSEAASIVTISSVSGREVDFAAGPYGTMKAAIIHYTQGLAYQFAAKGIRANSLSPGNTYFPGGVWENIEHSNPELYAAALGLNPTGRMARPEEIARAAVFLASPAASFVTGANLLVDGALTRGVQF